MREHGKICGVIGGVGRGLHGRRVIRHSGIGFATSVMGEWVLRLTMCHSSTTPVERLFLRKVGGGYIFLHRMLLEYFATLEEPPVVRTRNCGHRPVILQRLQATGLHWTSWELVVTRTPAHGHAMFP